MKRSIRNIFEFVAVPSLLVLFSGLLSGCSSADPKTAATATVPDEPATRPSFSLQKKKLNSVIRIPGEMIAFQQVDLYAKVNSFVKTLSVDVGSEVHTGQVLATLEAPELNSQLAGAQSKLQAQQASWLASKANYDRLYETSQTPGTVSGNDLDQALARRNADSAQLEAARSAYSEIADTRDYLVIRAPFNGIITARNVNPGAYVGPAGKGSEFPLFTLQEQTKLRLVVSVPEAYTGYFSNSTRVNFTVKTFPDKKFTATVNRMAGALDTRLRSERIEMDVINNDKKLLPGMVAEVTIPLPAADSTFVVPKTAVVNSTERVFVIRVSNGKADWVDVKTGREADGKLEIYGSLQTGDELIAKASEEIRNGEPVKTSLSKP